ncbi:MAG: hypothetical protein N2689_15955 [Verrucomicrobiae bacterium]|nr:hypothetical protein [Verrucomicrobiae bacterium]
MPASAQFSPVQLEVKPITSKKDLSTTFGNAASYAHRRALRITLKNTSSQSVSGITV